MLPKEDELVLEYTGLPEDAVYSALSSPKGWISLCILRATRGMSLEWKYADDVDYADEERESLDADTELAN